MKHNYLWKALDRFPVMGCCCRSVASTRGVGTVGVLCPGQSSQYIGMMNSEQFSRNKKISEMVGTANDILGYDIVKICEYGPSHLLNRTIHCQPAVVVATLLAFEMFKERGKANGEDVKVDCVAGYSVGEISALYISGKVTFQDAILLLRERASAMDYSSQLTPSGMLAMQGLSFEEARQVCEELTSVKNDAAHYVSIAIEQSVNAVALGGSILMLNKIMNREHKKLHDDSVKLAMVNVSGAFHTDYMIPAQEQFCDILHQITFNNTDIQLYSNVTGKKYNLHRKDGIGEPDDICETDDIRELLVRQLCEPVLWNVIMKDITRDVHTGRLNKLYEMGPGKQLKAIVSKIDRKVVRKVDNVSL